MDNVCRGHIRNAWRNNDSKGDNISPEGNILYGLWRDISYSLSNLSWRSFKAQISHACLRSYWWRTTLERWIIINIWSCKMKLSALRRDPDTRPAGWFYFSIVGSENVKPRFSTVVWSNEIHLFLVRARFYLRRGRQLLCNEWIWNKHSWVSKERKKDISVWSPTWCLLRFIDISHVEILLPR